MSTHSDTLFQAFLNQHDDETWDLIVQRLLPKIHEVDRNATQELTNAAANDKRDYFSRDPRCIPGEGPIPVQCRSAACGTCWVGILGGAEKLSEVRRLEAQRIKEFGYINTSNPKPIIRLACQAQAVGAVSIVIQSRRMQ